MGVFYVFSEKNIDLKNCEFYKSKIPDHKQHCKSCKVRHLPPTGKKCQHKKSFPEESNELSRDAAVASGTSTSRGSEDGQLLQKQILEQLRQVTDRLDQVEHRVAATATSSTPKQELSRDSFLQTIKFHKKSKKQYKSSSSSSSSNDSDDPTLETLKSHKLQQKVDARIRELNHSSHLPGKSKKLKYNSQRGGSVDVQVKHKVHWPHEAVLGGLSRQRVTYDQLSLTQWVQGFCRNILEERSGTRKDTMISYLADLMEDATDFTWQGAKASHAVLLCEMERGTLQWEDGNRIDRIRRAHAQKHIPIAKSAWSKNEKKPWFCKNFQSNSCTHQRDHEVNGRLNKHICAFCLTLGKQLNHSEKNCLTKQSSKNEQTAVNR